MEVTVSRVVTEHIVTGEILVGAYVDDVNSYLNWLSDMCPSFKVKHQRRMGHTGVHRVNISLGSMQDLMTYKLTWGAPWSNDVC